MNMIINPDFDGHKKLKLNKTVLFSWIAVLAVTLLFWVFIATAYKDDYVPRALAKIHRKEHKFLANHKAWQRKIATLRSSIV